MAIIPAQLEDSESLFRENKDYLTETIFWPISFNLTIQQPNNLKKNIMNLNQHLRVCVCARAHTHFQVH
jgi:hypothetical protein